MAMVRKQVYIDPAQDRLLKRRATELGVTEAELIRRALDSLARTPASPAFDPEAWQMILESMDKRARIPSTGEGRTWTRDELYRSALVAFLVDTNVLVYAYD